MFNKTRRRIVFTVVFSLLALMSVTLGTIYISNRISLRRENEEMLKTYSERFSLGGRPDNPEGDKPEGEKPEGEKPEGEKPEGQSGKDGRREGEQGRDEPRFQLSTFYSVAYSSEGEVLEVNNGNGALQSEDSLLEIASSALKSGNKSGSNGNIHYLVSERENYTLVAMIDGTVGENSQQTLFKEMLVIGAAAMVVLLFISVFIARRIVKPLEENDKRQKRFVSDAGHELKTPIAVVSANSELLRREIGENEWLSNIDYENDRMSDLVKQLLALSKAENGDLPKETLDFSKLADGEALPFETLAFEKGKRIVCETEPGLCVKGNPNQLRQLVSVLLDNALSHGTGEEIGLTLKREKHFASLTVTNGAPKISEDQLGKLFDRFYRADESRTESGSHYGLGLSIAKAVAESHGGQIHAAYKDGKAVFTVLIPLEK